MTKVGILGASGRVGTLLIKNISSDDEVSLACVFAKDKINNLSKDSIQSDDLYEFLNSCDGVIDFSLPEATEALLTAILDKKITKPLVVGTTGLSLHQQNLLTQVSLFSPVLYSSNMSLGVAMLNKVVASVASRLREFDCEIVEQHHKFKQDSPSGTALTLGESVANARGLDLDKVMMSGRNGHIGQRENDEIGIMAVRGGDVVGRHTVGFYNDGEFLELNHTATSRETFSKGALSVFKWLVKQKTRTLHHERFFRILICVLLLVYLGMKTVLRSLHLLCLRCSTADKSLQALVLIAIK